MTLLRRASVSAVLLGVGGLTAAVALAAPAAPVPPPTPTVAPSACSPGSQPETTQGRAPLADVKTGRYAKGYTCNAVQVAHTGVSGGYRVERYVDRAGHECAYADTTLLYPKDAPTGDGPGTYVYDMKDPKRPVLTTVLRTAAMSSPHESLRLNVKRGLLAAVFSYPTTQPGVIDVYDVKADCRAPQLLSTTPLGLLGHEGGFAPDGLTYYSGSLYFRTVTAIDLLDPRVPKTLWTSTDYESHGLVLSDDGKTLYMSQAALSDDGFSGLTVLDVSQVQARVLNPRVPVVSRLTWPSVSTPQSAVPFTRGGKKYLMEIDEFGSGSSIGAGRIIDINNIKKPFVVSELRLAVNQAKVQGGAIEKDPGNSNQFQGYQGHYCSLPSRVDPNVLACSFIMSGLRVFDIKDVKHPREIAYFNKPNTPGLNPMRSGAFAMSAPAYDGATGDIWYTDGNSGFYVVRLAGTAKRVFASRVVTPGS